MIIDNFDFDKILIDGKSQENILIYGISYKTLIGPKPSRINFDKIYWIIRIYDGTKYFLCGSEKYDAIYNRIRYLLSLKSSIADVFSHYHTKVKVDSYDSLPIKKDWLCIML